MNQNVEYPRTCSTCGRTYQSEATWNDHVRMGHAIGVCPTCGGNRVKMCVPDSSVIGTRHKGWRTVRFCPVCKSATCWTTRETGEAHNEPVEGEMLTRLQKQYDAVANRPGGKHA